MGFSGFGDGGENFVGFNEGGGMDERQSTRSTFRNNNHAALIYAVKLWSGSRKLNQNFPLQLL